MAVRMPQYDQQTTPNGLLNISGFPHASPAENPGYVGAGMQQFGQAIDQAAQAFQHVQDGDVLAQRGKFISDENNYWRKQLQDNYDGSPDGQGIVSGTLAAFDKRVSDVTGAETNLRAKRFMEQHYLSLREHLSSTGLSMEQNGAVVGRDKNIDDAFNGIKANVANGSMSFADAKNLMDSTIANANYDPVTRNARVLKYRNQLAEIAQTGLAERDPVATKQALQQYYSTPFDRAMGFVFKAEGGYSPADSNGYEVNRGINAQYHPNEDIRNMSEARAKEIYKNDYWNKIDGDAIAARDPKLATMVMDTAVMSGPKKAKELLEKSGGDPNRFMDMREAFLGNLLNNPNVIPSNQRASIERAWGKRNADLRNAPDGTPSSNQSAVLASLNPERIPQFIGFAEGVQNRNMATTRAQMETTVHDHNAMFMNGVTVQQPLDMSSFVRGYGEIEGPQRWNAYQQNMQLGSDIQTMKTMPVARQMQFLEENKPDEGNPNYATQVKRFDKLSQAANRVNQERISDPVNWAMQTQVAGVKPLSFDNTASFGQSLASRIGPAKMMADTYGAPLQLLSKGETATLQGGFQKMTTDNKLAYLKTIGQSVPDEAAYRSVMQQIAPDSPVTAHAGMILQKQRVVTSQNWFTADDTMTSMNVAGIMIEGEALLNPNKATKAENGVGKMFPMPADKDLRIQFNDIVGKSFAGNAADADYAFQSFKAFYAGKAARDGDVSGQIDSTRAKLAVKAVTGGVSNPTGKADVIRPWGMSDASFQTAIEGSFARQMEANHYTGTPQAKMSLYGIVGYRDGQYMLNNGSNFMTGRDGEPIVLDVRDAPNFGGPPAQPGGASASGPAADAALAPIAQKPEKILLIPNSKGVGKK